MGALSMQIRGSPPEDRSECRSDICPERVLGPHPVCFQIICAEQMWGTEGVDVRPRHQRGSRAATAWSEGMQGRHGSTCAEVPVGSTVGVVLPLTAPTTPGEKAPIHAPPLLPSREHGAAAARGARPCMPCAPMRRDASLRRLMCYASAAVTSKNIAGIEVTAQPLNPHAGVDLQDILPSCLCLTKHRCSGLVLRATCSERQYATEAWTTFPSVFMRPGGLVARSTAVPSPATSPFGKRCNNAAAKSSGTGALARTAHTNACRGSRGPPRSLAQPVGCCHIVFGSRADAFGDLKGRLA